MQNEEHNIILWIGLSGVETFGEEVTSIWTENDEPIDNALLGALGLIKQI